MDIYLAGSRPTRRASSDWFTGTVWQDPINTPPAPARVNSARVAFEPGARTAWHTHPLGQTLFVVSGVGRVQTKAGTRAAFDGLRLAGAPKDMARIATLAAVKGGKTRAVLKLLGRGAFVLTRSAIHLALWIFWAAANLIGFCASLKRAVERMTLGIIRHRKARRLAARLDALEACARTA